MKAQPATGAVHHRSAGPGQSASLDDLQAKAAAVHEALPWIKRLSGCTVVVKYGGAAMGTVGFDAFVDDVVLLR